MNFINTKIIQLDLFKILSHPDTLLIIHLNDVAKKAYKKIKYLNIANNLKEAIYYSALFHDFGKSSSFFQERLKTGKKNRFSNHSLISALAGFYYTKNPYVFLAIRYHHLNLDECNKMCNISDKEKDVLLTIAKNIDKEIIDIYKAFRIDFDLDGFIEFIEKEIDEYGLYIELEENDFFDFLIVFSSLIYADKEEAIFQGNKKEIKINFNANFVEKYKQAKIKQKYKIDYVREKIYKEVTQIDTSKDVIFIELPTGTGKTFALLNIAMQFNRKIFYLLPFITLIEQNASIFKEILEFNGLDVEDNRIFYEKHSLSGEFNIKVKDEYDLDKREFLSDSFDSNVIITTFNQFFYSFFKSKNSFLKRVINITNSVIIIDEIQAIKEELFWVIEELFNFLITKFNIKIVIATATMPRLEIKNSLFVKKIDEILEEKELSFFDRYDMDLNIKEFDEESIIEFIDEKLKLNKDLLFRVNTINMANFIYEYIGKGEILTSAIPPILRRDRIKRIKQNGGIVTATQVIQAGVDISLEDGFEELAPLEMLIQSMGRRNRSGEKTRGFANLVRLKMNGFDGSKVYDKSIIDRTLKILKNKEIVSEPEFRELLKKYYKKMGVKKDFGRFMKGFNFKTIDKKFELIENVKTIQFFCVMDNKSEILWEELKTLEVERKDININENFWEQKRKLEAKFNKIKKDVFLYTSNARLYKSDEKYKFDNEFEKAMSFYRVDDRIFDIEKGVNIKKFLKEEKIFW